jgi:integrase
MAANERGARLTKRNVDAAEKAERRWTLWDSDLKGFGLRVEPSGAKTFIVRYRAGGGRRGTLRQFKIGSYGKLTPDQAREEAERILALAELGKDPQRERQQGRAELTVSELCDLYLAEGVGTKKASTVAIDQIRVDRHIKPLLGSRKIGDITGADIQRVLRDVASGKVRNKATPHTRGGEGAASRTVGLLSGVFKFAVERRLCAENPVKGVKRFKDRKRERFLSPEELGRLGDALTGALAEGADPRHVAIIRILALSGARKNEIARLNKSEIRDGGAWLQLEDSKTGQKVIKLGAAAQEVLVPYLAADGSWIFPDPRDPRQPIRNLDWFWVRIRKRAVLPDVRIHDLRHSYASAGIASGAGLYLIGKLLGHAQVSTTARYAHLADDPVKVAADRISKQISAAMKGQSGSVDPLERRR